MNPYTKVLALDFEFGVKERFGKVLGTQNRLTFRLAFICITLDYLTMIFINQTLNMYAVISKQITIKSGEILSNIPYEGIRKYNAKA